MNTTTDSQWELAASRKIGLFECLLAEGAYRALPFDCRMDNVLISADGAAKRYNSHADSLKFEAAITSNDMKPILEELAKNDDELAAVLPLDPISNREHFITAVKNTWKYEILAYYVGIYSKDRETLSLVEQLRGVHNAQHQAATEFIPALLNQMAEKTGISAELLKYATPEEVIGLKFNEQELIGRQKFYIITTLVTKHSYMWEMKQRRN